jgi:hypothetical protein
MFLRSRAPPPAPASEFLAPSPFRRALRQPEPAERDYLAAQFTGVGVAVGGRSSSGGWAIEAALAESPAEEAGIRRGERIVGIGTSVCASVGCPPAPRSPVRLPAFPLCLLPGPARLPACSQASWVAPLWQLRA